MKLRESSMFVDWRWVWHYGFSAPSGPIAGIAVQVEYSLAVTQDKHEHLIAVAKNADIFMKVSNPIDRGLLLLEIGGRGPWISV
jgi:aryl-alcohol dehydrogenase-like predicted oxidoreductase